MKNLAGRRFGRLIAIRALRKRSSNGAVLWWCRCDCKKRVIVASNSLLSGHSKSRGCWHRDAAAKQINVNRPKISACLRHGGTSKFSDPALTRAYRIYRGMICRCYNTHAPNWRFYGGMGVQVDARWLGENGFKHFITDCGLPKMGESISRWMDCGDYSPLNARFATAKEQRAEKAKKRRFIQQTLKAELRIGPYGPKRSRQKMSARLWSNLQRKGRSSATITRASATNNAPKEELMVIAQRSGWTPRSTLTMAEIKRMGALEFRYHELFSAGAVAAALEAADQGARQRTRQNRR